MSLNPIGVLIAAIAALVVGVVYAYTHFDWFRNAVDSVWQAMQSFWDWVLSAFVTIGEVLAKPFILWWEVASFIYGNIWNGIVAVVDFVAGKIGDIVGFVIGLPGRVAGYASTAFDAIKGAITGAADTVWHKIEDMLGWFVAVPGRVGNALGGVAEVITSPFRPAFNAIANLWNGTIGRLSFHIPDWVPGIGGKGFDVPDIPTLDSGGLVIGPTLAALSMNSVPEVVSPVPQLRQIVREESRAAGGGGGGVTYNLYGATALTRTDLDSAYRAAAFRVRVGAA